jgi:hypothetical protein
LHNFLPQERKSERHITDQIFILHNFLHAIFLQVEARLRQLEGKIGGAEAAAPRGLPGAQKYEPARANGGATLTPARAYNPDADAVPVDKSEKKKKKRKEREVEEEEQAAIANGDASAEKPKKKKKKDGESKEKKEKKRKKDKGDE